MLFCTYQVFDFVVNFVDIGLITRKKNHCEL